MSFGHSNEYPSTEAEFRALYRDVKRKSRPCGDFDFDGEENSCKNTCNYLLAFDPEAINENDSLPAIFGIDCHPTVNEWWDGDCDNVRVEAYCKECAPAQLRTEEDNRLAEEKERRRLAKQEQRDLESKHQETRLARKEWLDLSASDFELHCTRLFLGLGFEAQRNRRGPDGGIDIKLRNKGKQGAAQCKALGKPCGVKPVRECSGVFPSEGLEFGYFIARSGFTRDAKTLLKKLRLKGMTIEGWDVDDLVAQSSKIQS